MQKFDSIASQIEDSVDNINAVHHLLSVLLSITNS